MTTTFNLNSSTINTVEVGDALQAEFYPQLKIRSWDNECNLSVRLTSSISGTTFEKPNGEINWYDDQNGRRASFYDYTTLSGCDEGGYEFEVWLDEKPKSNVLEFSIRTKGFDFFYQDELTDDEKYTTISGVRVQTNFRPENVVGSYAVYHKTKQHGTYGTGKAFHIFRPWAEDASGVRVWCELHVDEENELLTITIPEEFYNTAQYPVLVDPTFGNTTAGTSYQTQPPDYAVCFLANAPTNLEVNSVSVRASEQYSFSTTNFKPVVWDVSTGSVLTNGVGNATAIVGTTAYWVTGSYTTAPTCSNGSSAYFGCVFSSSFGTTPIYYDNTNNTYTGYRDTSNNYAVPQIMNGGSTSYKYSIYITYTTATDPPEYDQLHYRWRNDDGGETTATWLENEDTDHDGDDGFTRLRFLVDNTGNDGDDPFTIEYSTDTSIWEELPTTSGIVGGWVEHFDNNDWSVLDGIGSWSSNTWIPSVFGGNTYILNIGVIGSWATSYRPTKMRITFTGSITCNYNCRISDTDNGGIWDADSDPISSGQELTLTFGSYDIYSLSLSSSSNFTVTDIGFYESSTGWTPYPVYIKDSTNITNGSATTTQLTTPSGKTTGDFDAGEIIDTSDTTGSITTSSGGYTEVEYSLGFNTDDTYYFRIAELDTYTEGYATYTYTTGEEYNDSISDSHTFNDNATYELVINPTASDSFTLNDSVDENQTIQTTASDSYTVDDTTTTELVIPTSVNDSYTLNDDSSPALEISQTIADSFTTNDTVTSTLDITNTVSDSLSLNDTNTATVDTSYSVDDSFTHNDESSANITMNLTASDTITFSDSVTASQIFIGIASDSFVFDDASCYGETVCDNITLNDSAYAEVTYNTVATDSFTVNDSNEGHITFTLTGSDSLTISDTSSNTLTITQSVSDSTILDDTNTASNNLFTDITDTVLFNDTASCYLDILQAIQDSFTLNDSSTNTITFTYAVGDAIEISDDLTEEVVFNATSYDTVVISDSSDNTLVVYYNVTDGCFVADTVLPGTVFSVDVSDAVFIDDSVGNNIKINVFANDVVEVNDFINKTMVYAQNVSDGFSVTTSTDGEYGYIVTASFVAENRTYTFEVKTN